MNLITKDFSFENQGIKVNFSVAHGEASNLVYFNQTCYSVPISFDITGFIKTILESLEHNSSESIEERFSKELHKLQVEKTSKVGLTHLNKTDVSPKNYLDFLGQTEISLKDLNALDADLENLTKLALEGNKEATELIHKCAINQTVRAQKRIETINLLKNNHYYQEECRLQGSNPLFGYLDKPSYYMTSSYNAYFQLAKMASKENSRLALSYYTKGIQLTDFLGETFPEIPEIQELLKKNYKELTRRIPEQEKLEISIKTPKLDEKNEAFVFRQLIRSMNALDFNFLRDPEYGPMIPYIALKAVEKGFITVDQFATLMRIWSLKDQAIEVHSVSEPEIREMIESTLRVAKLEKDPWLGDLIVTYSNENNNFLSPSQLEDFWSKVSTALPSEQVVILIEENIKKDSSSISAFISYQIGFNVFARPKESRKRMIPSASLEEAFLEARYQSPVLPNYVLGPSTIDDIRLNGLNMTRDVATPFPGLPLPRYADNRPAPLDVDFVQHDFFHCYSCSEVGEAGPLFITVADFVKLEIEQTNDKDIELYYNFLIDLDYPVYRHQVKNQIGWVKDGTVPREALFWFCLAENAVFARNLNVSLNGLLEKLTRFLIEEQQMNLEFLKMASAHVRNTLAKQTLTEGDKWMVEDHPIFRMLAITK